MMSGNRKQRVALSPVKEAAAVPKEEVWEVRPGGMLVQKRSPDADPPPVPTIRVKVKFNGVYHEIYINSQASFGELKKLVSEKTGLHPDDQKVVYKDKERDSKAFLDMAGVKDRSKMVMLEDPAAKAKRLLEERRTSKAERAAKAIARVALDVDKLATKVSALETVASKGGEVVDADVATLTEALMRELVELDSIAADGDAKAQRRAQERRVQRHVETLDAIRAKNKAAAPSSNRTRRPAHLPPRPQNQQRRQFQPPAPTTATAPAPQTQTAASWDSFDLLSSVPPSTSAAAPVTSTTTPSPRLEWELF
uniref:Protein binding protein n=1 Tax=Zea mays TaxID=4577 RepID=B6TTR9_MAIZE|nr:protein binding protein [Zea mays]|eukprot:NP_001150807.1 protein binding protein [Zea mays]